MINNLSARSVALSIELTTIHIADSTIHSLNNWRLVALAPWAALSDACAYLFSVVFQ